MLIEDEPYTAEAIRDGLPLEAIGADIAGDGHTALALLNANAYDRFRREVSRDARCVALTRKQFAVLEVLVAAEGGVVGAEGLLRRGCDENADPFTKAVPPEERTPSARSVGRSHLSRARGHTRQTDKPT